MQSYVFFAIILAVIASVAVAAPVPQLEPAVVV